MALLLLGVGILSERFGGGRGLGELGTGIQQLIAAPLTGTGMGLSSLAGGVRDIAETFGDLGRGISDLLSALPSLPSLPGPGGSGSGQLPAPGLNGGGGGARAGLVPDSGGSAATIKAGGGGNVPPPLYPGVPIPMPDPTPRPPVQDVWPRYLLQEPVMMGAYNVY